jgi:UDP-N-acetylmuramoyl-L-alanyl-D-glutamate--2,6-diaminopimelate ligase
MHSSVTLGDLLRAVPESQWARPPAAPPQLRVGGLRHDSRAVVSGDVFFAIPGVRTDGARFARDALARGAVAVVVEGERFLEAPGALVLHALSVRRVMGIMAARFHGEPAAHLRVFGLTGTDGKTSTAWLARHLLASNGRRAVAAGTLGIKGDGETLSAWAGDSADGRSFGEAHRVWCPTTPEATDFQATLARLVQQGVEDVVTEVSSHALAQDRIYGTQFHTVALLHVSADHLDFHGTQAAYLAAKARLFDPDARGGPLERLPVRAVIRIDHALGRELADRCAGACLTFGRSHGANVRLTANRSGPAGQELELELQGEPATVRVPLLGRFHADNLVAAAAIGLSAGLTHEQVLRALATAPAIPGRFEAIAAGQDFAVIVDYAHTADALERVLPAAREVGRGRLILVFGCGGDRDPSKREPMGRVAARLADHVVLTTDNPRSEEPEAIARQVAAGLADGPAPWEAIADRRAALARALGLARPGDVVLVAGKGSEGYQIFRDRVASFDDRRVIRELLEGKPHGGAAA